MEASSHAVPTSENGFVKANDTSMKKYVEGVLESKVVALTMGVFTLWALFENDIRLAATGKDADEAFLVIVSIIFFCFSIEIVCSIYCKNGYWYVPNMERTPDEMLFSSIVRRCQIGSFHFWLDTIATSTLILEVL